MLQLVSGEDYLWRPVLAGLCSYRDVTENRVDLCDIATMNELLDVRSYNERVLLEEHQKQRERAARSPGPWPGMS